MTRALAVPSAVVAFVSVAACGGATGTVTAGSPRGPAASAPTSPTAAAPVAGPSLGSANSSWDGKPARLDVVRLTRSGDVTSLTVRLTNNGQGASDLQVTELFGKDSADATMDGIALVDSAHNKKYPVARDSHGVCVCDMSLGGTFVPPGQSVMLSAVFGAPPSGVTAVDVLVPHFGTFHNIAVSG